MKRVRDEIHPEKGHGLKAKPTAVAVVLLSLAAIAASVGFESQLYLNHDVAWYLQAALQTGFGRCRLYVDCFLDPNPPLILWLSGLVADAGASVGLDPVMSFRAFVGALAVGVWVLLYKVFSIVVRHGRLWPLAFATAYVAAVCVVSVTHLGQREHLIALLLASYVASQALIGERRVLGPTMTITCGVLAGIAVALKPHYALVIVVCEIWAVLRSGSLRPIARAETIALGGVVAAYLAAVVAFAPDYFAFIDVIRTAYRSYRMPADSFLARTDSIVLVLTAAIALAVSYPHRDRENPAFPFALAGAAAAVVYLVQQMGFGYHAIPVRVMSVFAVLCATLWPIQAGVIGRVRSVLATSGVVLVIAAHGLITYGSFRESTMLGDRSFSVPIAWAIDALRRHANEGRAGFVTTSVFPGLPAVLYAGNALAGRMPALWLLPAIVEPRDRDNEDIERVRATLFTALHEDLVRDPPAVIFERRGKLQAVSIPGFSPMQFLSTDPQLDRLFRQYREAEHATFGQDEYVVYVRRIALGASQHEVLR
jgi:hypothetical protein